MGLILEIKRKGGEGGRGRSRGQDGAAGHRSKPPTVRAPPPGGTARRGRKEGETREEEARRGEEGERGGGDRAHKGLRESRQSCREKSRQTELRPGKTKGLVFWWALQRGGCG